MQWLYDGQNTHINTSKNIRNQSLWKKNGKKKTVYVPILSGNSVLFGVKVWIVCLRALRLCVVLVPIDKKIYKNNFMCTETRKENNILFGNIGTWKVCRFINTFGAQNKKKNVAKNCIIWETRSETQRNAQGLRKCIEHLYRKVWKSWKRPFF